jgi:hypothetical protein
MRRHTSLNMRWTCERAKGSQRPDENGREKMKSTHLTRQLPSEVLDMIVDSRSNASQQSFDLVAQLRVHRCRLARLDVLGDFSEQFVRLVRTLGELSNEFVDVCGKRAGVWKE